MSSSSPGRADAVLDAFHPLVSGWFRARFGQPTEPQVRGWPEIAAGRDVLIAAPTGSGKTLAAFLSCLDQLIRRGISERGIVSEPSPGIEILYVSPLKALSNDIHRNLEAPLAEIRERAAAEGIALPPISVAVRTGDTPPAERAKMAKKPPHILVTTPESLYILLTAESSRKALANVRTVIVDEIHAVADSKRGAHLTLSLERLDRLVTQVAGARRPVRIGISATQRPIERIARMLVGTRRELPRILDSGHARVIDLAIESTDDELGPIASNEQFGRVYDRIAELVREHQTTLVFVNTRRLVERVSHHLEQRLGEDQVVAHHGSLSRKLRFAAEQKLKDGSVKCAVATASLELGIDVGAVDLVVQIGSPRRIATLVQRIGRSGHSLGATPKGRLFALTRDQLIESAALVRAVRAGVLDEVELRPAPLDILSQQIVATCACEDVGEDEMFELVTGATHYSALDRKDFDQVIEMLAEGISDRQGRARAHLFRDRLAGESGVLKGRRGARLVAITNGGAIGDVANYPVVLYPEETAVGSLDEDFAIESSAGDIFLLGNTSWRIRRVEATRVLVDDAKGLPPNIPFWFGEAPARTAELSDQVSALRADVEEKILAGESESEISTWLAVEISAPLALAEQAVRYLVAGRAALGAMPTKTRIIAERFFDNAGGMQLVLHSPLGGRINKAWGLALRKKFCRSFNFELQAAATDDGIVISLGPPHSFTLESVFRFVHSEQAVAVLEQAVLDAPVFTTRWRWAATRSLAVQRRWGAKKVPPTILRMRTDDLLTSVFPMQQACLENVVGDIELPDHPLVKETMRDCLSEFMDADGFTKLLAGFERGEIEIVCRDTSEPSPLCHELLSANPYAFLDDAPLEERRTRAISLPRGLVSAAAGEIGVVSDEAIATAEEQAHPPVRDGDELHDLLLSLYVVREQPAWSTLTEQLIASGRATRIEVAGGQLLVAAERLPIVLAVFEDAVPTPELPPLPFEVDVPDPDTAAMVIVRGHLEILGPTTVAALASRLGIDAQTIAIALGHLEAEGSILRGRFSAASRLDDAPEEVCDRRMLARAHRLTLGVLRREIEPVTAAALTRFLLRWQRVGSETKLIGADGVHRVIEQLQGFQAAAGAWERDLLPSRLHAYDASWLDNLCLSGQVSWARLSPRVAKNGGATAPTKAAPLSVMLRSDMPWLRASTETPPDPDDDLSESGARVFAELSMRGARFLPDLAAALSMKPTEIESALWELASAGLATADGFASLRVLVDRERGESKSRFDETVKRDKRDKRDKRKTNGLTPRGRWRDAIKRSRKRDAVRPALRGRSLAAAAGRWSLLDPPDEEMRCPESWARQLLCRYGVVFRDLLARESCLPPWREILVALRRLEARGEIRGGRFVSGFVGEQFAVPEALDGLRAMRNGPRHPELVTVAATDPLNLVGVTSAGPRCPSVIGNKILYRNGVPLASIEGGKLVVRQTLSPSESISENLEYRGPSPTLAAAEQVQLPL